jgi:hypothetical protein
MKEATIASIHIRVGGTAAEVFRRRWGFDADFVDGDTLTNEKAFAVRNSD